MALMENKMRVRSTVHIIHNRTYNNDNDVHALLEICTVQYTGWRKKNIPNIRMALRSRVI